MAESKEGFIEKALGWVKAHLPVVGGLAGDGARTSGAAAGVGVGYLVLNIEGLSPEWKAVCITALGIGWFISGALKKN